MSKGNDIALVRLPRPAITAIEDVEHPVLPICMKFNEDIIIPQDEVLVAGWGRTNNDPSDPGETERSGSFSSLLLKLKVPVVPVEECKSNYRIFKTIDIEKHLCAGGEKGITNALST